MVSPSVHSDLNPGEFFAKRGQTGAIGTFGNDPRPLLEQLNTALAA